MGATTLRFWMSPKCEDASRPLVGEPALAMYCIMMSRGEKPRTSSEPWLRIIGPEPFVGFQRVGRGARTCFLAQAEVHSAYDLALLVEILQRSFHLAIEQHPAIDLDALLLAEIFRIADRRDGALRSPETS